MDNQWLRDAKWLEPQPMLTVQVPVVKPVDDTEEALETANALHNNHIAEVANYFRGLGFQSTREGIAPKPSENGFNFNRQMHQQQVLQTTYTSVPVQFTFHRNDVQRVKDAIAALPATSITDAAFNISQLNGGTPGEGGNPFQ